MSVLVGTYNLGPRIIELGRIARSDPPLLKVAVPILDRFSATTNETAVPGDLPARPMRTKQQHTFGEIHASGS